MPVVLDMRVRPLGLRGQAWTSTSAPAGVDGAWVMVSSSSAAVSSLLEAVVRQRRGGRSWPRARRPGWRSRSAPAPSWRSRLCSCTPLSSSVAAQLVARLLEGVEADLLVGGDRRHQAVARGAQVHVDLAELGRAQLEGRARVAGAGRGDADELLDALGGLQDRGAGELRRAAGARTAVCGVAVSWAGGALGCRRRVPARCARAGVGGGVGGAAGWPASARQRRQRSAAASGPAAGRAGAGRRS